MVDAYGGGAQRSAIADHPTDLKDENSRTQAAESTRSANAGVSVVFVLLLALFGLSGALLWMAQNVSRPLIFFFVFSGWIVSLCLHEFAHAAVAYRCGDRTVAEKGYLTLNPLRYTDRRLSILLPVLFILVGGIGLPGAAVYIDRSQLRSRRQASLVSLAGPISNLICALVLLAPFWLVRSTVLHHQGFAFACAALAILEVVAAILNSLPIPPFDGFGVLEPLFPRDSKIARVRSRSWVAPVVLIALLQANGPSSLLWHAAYNIGYASHVPRGEAGEGLQLFRFWRSAPAAAPSLTPTAIPSSSGISAPGTPLPQNPLCISTSGLRASISHTAGADGIVLTLHWKSPDSPGCNVFRASDAPGVSSPSETPADAKGVWCEPSTNYLMRVCPNQPLGTYWFYVTAYGIGETTPQPIAAVKVSIR